MGWRTIRLPGTHGEVGAAVGLVAGGLLTTYLSWRWVLFDVIGAIMGTSGIALVVYGLSNASTDPSGV